MDLVGKNALKAKVLEDLRVETARPWVLGDVCLVSLPFFCSLSYLV